MKYLFLIAIPVYLLSCKPAPPPYNLFPQNSQTDALLIGLHALSDEVIWASGTKSTITRTVDGGDNWTSTRYPDADTLQFRDIHGWDENQAIVLSIGEGKASTIFHFSTDSGWTEVYRMPFDKGFLDAFDFWENGQGIAYGDAIDSLPFILKTEDFGLTWERMTDKMPNSGKGEGGFASSGTCVETGADGQVWIGTGASGNARILYSDDFGMSWIAYHTPMVKGDAAGITSVRFVGNVGFITGGDLAKKEEWSQNVFWTDTKGKSWYPLPQPKTHGALYGSGFAKVKDQYVTLTCGPEGADLSLKLGAEWTKISPDELWTATLLPSGNGWLAGKRGKLLKLELD
jgi:photosystem II stability/assembly factor-like uncharacterized protein